VWLANLLTFLVVMVGWTLFRAASLAQAGAFLAAMADPLAASADPIAIPDETIVVAAIAAAICLAQRLYVSFGSAAGSAAWSLAAQRHAFAANSLLALLFVCAVGKGLADPFKPFIYFRF
jgi:alginate O-acetyltransferase complex protein AlgI